VGLDKEKRYIGQARKISSLELVLGDGTDLPFKDESFTFVLCNDVLEHVADSEKLAKELLRVLAQGSTTYIQCAGKYQIMEPHFLLPFLSWLPQPLATLYLRLTRKGESYAGYHPKTRKQILRLFREYRAIDLTYERTLMKIKTLNIKSKSLLRAVSCLREVLPDQVIAMVAEKFSILAILVFKERLA
jgi:ubiquinone/menaquinone biosynthesis C-methylase UbiE